MLPFNNFIVIFFLFGLLSGCSVSHRIVHEDGVGEVPEELFSKVKNRSTKRDWVDASFGAPTTKLDVEENLDVYTYAYKLADYQRISVLFVFNYNTVERKQTYIHMVFKNGVVVKHCEDEFSEVQEKKYNEFKEPPEEAP